MKFLKYIFIGCILTSAVSCSDFLEEKSETQISKEGIYNDPNTALGVLNGCYAKLADYNYFSFNYFHVMSATSGVGTSIKANDVDMGTFNILPTNVNVGKMYIGEYEALGVANDIIDGMKSTSISDETVKNKIIGEALFIRAMTYFNLVRQFGKISLYLSPVEDYNEAQIPRSEVSEVYKVIIQDLKDAFDKLPEPGKQDIGSPNKYAAKALLAKVYITLAGNETNSQYWELAYNTAKEVYDFGKYSLVRPYSSLFGSTNKNNAESIFEIQFSSVQSGCRLTETTFPQGHSLMPDAKGSNSWGKTVPTRSMFDMFDPADPRREATFCHTSYVNIKDKKTYMLYPTTRKADGTLPKGMKVKIGTSEYPAWKKYVDPTLVTYSNCNFVYMRYADLLLLLAESANELNGKTSEAVGYLNEVLDRARDVNGDSKIDPIAEIYPQEVDLAITKEELRTKILKERLFELSGEADEWYTIRRRGADFLKNIVKAHNKNLEKLSELPKYVYRLSDSENDIKKNLLLPFPSEEINRNEKISQDDQNYGY